MTSAPVTLYSSEWCGYCWQAKQLLERKGVAYRELVVDGDAERRREMETRSGRRTVPQIFVGEAHIGGYDDLAALERAGKLDDLLKTAGSAPPA